VQIDRVIVLVPEHGDPIVRAQVVDDPLRGLLDRGELVVGFLQNQHDVQRAIVATGTRTGDAGVEAEYRRAGYCAGPEKIPSRQI
jgi:hypothetical protein